MCCIYFVNPPSYSSYIKSNDGSLAMSTPRAFLPAQAFVLLFSALVSAISLAADLPTISDAVIQACIDK